MFLYFILNLCFVNNYVNSTTQKMKFSIKDLFSKCDQIRIFLWIWSHLLEKSLMENFTFCGVYLFKSGRFSGVTFVFIIP